MIREPENACDIHKVLQISILGYKTLKNEDLALGVDGVHNRGLKGVVASDNAVLKEGSAFILRVDHSSVNGEVVLNKAVRASD